MKYTKFYDKGVREEDLKAYEEAKKIDLKQSMKSFLNSLAFELGKNGLELSYSGFGKLFKDTSYKNVFKYIDDDKNYRIKTKGITISFNSVIIKVFVVEEYITTFVDKETGIKEKEYLRDYYCVEVYKEGVKEQYYLIPMNKNGNAKPGLAEVGDKQIASLIRTLVEEEINRVKEELKL